MVMLLEIRPSDDLSPRVYMEYISCTIIIVRKVYNSRKTMLYMPTLTLRDLEAPSIILTDNIEIVAIKNSPSIDLEEGQHELSIYKCKSRQYNRKTGKDMYVKGDIITKVIVVIPDEDTIYI